MGLKHFGIAIALLSITWSSTIAQNYKEYYADFLLAAKVPKHEVKHLNLSSQRLRGIPRAMEGYSEVRILNFSKNACRNIPKELPFFPKLEKLIAKNCKIKATDYASYIPSSVTVIDLSGNRIKSIDLSVFSHLNLDTLRLNNNEIEEIHCSGRVPSIKVISISKNKLETISPELMNVLSQCVDINLTGNQIGNLGNLCSNLNRVKTLHIAENPIPTLPVELFRIPTLETLNMFGVQAQVLPDAIVSSNISHIVLGSFHANSKQVEEVLNKAKGVKRVTVIGSTRFREWNLNLENIETLVIDGCPNFQKFMTNTYNRTKLLQEFSTDWYQPEGAKETMMPNLRSLTITDCNLTRIPKVFETFDKLEYLDLSKNKISALDEDINMIQGFSRLKTLNLSYNVIDSFPKHFEILQGLESLILTNYIRTTKTSMTAAELFRIRKELFRTELALYSPILERNFYSKAYTLEEMAAVRPLFLRASNSDDGALYELQKISSERDDELFEFIYLVENLNLQERCTNKWLALNTVYAELMVEKYPWVMGIKKVDIVNPNSQNQRALAAGNEQIASFLSSYTNTLSFSSSQLSEVQMESSAALEIYKDICNCEGKEAGGKTLKAKACKEVYNETMKIVNRLKAERTIVNNKIHRLIGGVEDWGSVDALSQGVAELIPDEGVGLASTLISLIAGDTQEEKEAEVKRLQDKVRGLDKSIEYYSNKAEEAFKNARF